MGIGSKTTVGTAVVVGLLAGSAAHAGGNNPAKVEAMRQRREGALSVGAAAPDAPVLALNTVADAAGGATPNDRILAHKRPNRPLVLIFGSFT